MFYFWDIGARDRDFDVTCGKLRLRWALRAPWVFLFYGEGACGGGLVLAMKSEPAVGEAVRDGFRVEILGD